MRIHKKVFVNNICITKSELSFLSDNINKYNSDKIILILEKSLKLTKRRGLGLTLI